MLTTPAAMTLQQPVRYERPPEGLARGRIQVPWWVVVAVAATLVVLAVAFLVGRFVASVRAARGPSEPPRT
ncbi:MAG: hypothetical protein R3B70_16560 [Polyangiaceae bacterium]